MPAEPRDLRVASAQTIIASLIIPIDQPQQVPICDCLGRILAQDVMSPIDVPPHDNSAMDGYAVRGADLKPNAETALAIIGVALIGAPFASEPGPAQAVRSTGSQGSGALRSMTESDGITVLEHERGDIGVGDWVEVMPFKGLL